MSKHRSSNEIKGSMLNDGKVPQPKMNISASVIDGNTVLNEEVKKTDKQIIADKKLSGAIVEDRCNIGWIISRLDEPKDVDYNGNVIRVSGRAKIKIADYTKLGKLPTGIVLKK